MAINRDDVLTLAVFMLISLTAWGIAGLATQSSVNDWFPTLSSPPYNPPRWLIPVAWIILYLFIGIAGFLVWRQKNSSDIVTVMTVFGLHLILNMGWPILFFGLQEIGWAFLELCLFWISVVSFIVLAWPISRWAAYLFVPYALWLTYAGYLNFMYWYLN